MPSAARLSQSVAIAASAIGLLCACGIGYHNTAPPPPPPLAAKLTLSTPSLSFDTRTIGTSSPPQQFVVTNNSLDPVTLDSIVPYGPMNNFNFEFEPKPCLTELAPGKSCTITVIFHPATIGYCYNRLLLHLPGYANMTVLLTGTSLAPADSKPPSRP